MTTAVHGQRPYNGAPPDLGMKGQTFSATFRATTSDGRQSLFPAGQPAQMSQANGGAPQRNDNIMNRRGTEGSSLFKICENLRRRMALVPGCDIHIAEMDEEELEAGETTDPVTTMWNCLRRGYPLMTIYNALQPPQPLTLDASRMAETRVGKAATFKFLQACLTDLKIPANECFLITDLYGGDTTGFVKVTKVVNRVLDILDERGLLMRAHPSIADSNTSAGPRALTRRQNIIQEIVQTERDYVQQIEDLQHFKNELEMSGAVGGDAIHDIFLNINALLDFQRRFLIRIEQQNSLPDEEQNWGNLFITYRDSFRVYEPFIANGARCNETVTKEWDRLKSAPISPDLQGMVEAQSIMLGFLVKPLQRLTKYPLLLKDLIKDGGLDDDKTNDLHEGLEAAKTICGRANEAIAKEERLAALLELQNRVEDWKGHKTEHFGELLLHGQYLVIKGEGAKEVERDYKIFLFEKILLCCKEINPNKPKNKMLGGNKPLLDKKGKPKLQLKGRIFMANVTDVISVVKPDKSSYMIQIYWKGEPAVENFVIKFPNPDSMGKWRDAVQSLKGRQEDNARVSGTTLTSDTEFTSLEKPSKNPYLQEDEYDDDDATAPTLASRDGSNFNVSRNASNTSLRSANIAGRVPPPRFPVPEPAYATGLSIQTNVPSGGSPGEFGGNSYFSPGGDSPQSLRSSQQAFNGFNQGFPPGNLVMPQGSNKRRTEPPMPRAPSRDGSMGPSNSYNLNGRTVQRPSLPAMTPSQAAQQQMAMNASRLRSASTPDIHQEPRRYPNGALQGTIDSVPVPPLPPSVVQHRVHPGLNRSQTSSPINSQLPYRAATQSPQLQVNQTMPHHLPSNPRDHNLYNDPSHRQRPRLQETDTQIYAPQHHHQQQQATNFPSNNPDPQLQVLKSPPLPATSGTGGPLSPPPSTSGATGPISGPFVPNTNVPYPSQLKVKVWFDPLPSHVTIVVPIIIKHQSLIDRIDSKMVKVSPASIARGTARLKYRDEEGDLVTITNDEEVGMAIEGWGTQHLGDLAEGLAPDFELFWGVVK